jgi:hypothetical protein
MHERVVGDLIAARLSFHLGPNVARMAVKTFAQQALACTPEQVTPAEVPRLIEAMRPMLAVMMGKDPSRVVLDEIARDCMEAGH